ncbi:MAG: hypothetical protein ACR2K5_16235, partial [Pseudolabrys sp.]
MNRNHSTLSQPESTSLVDGVNAAIRENPLAAVLVGGGIAWMLFGSARLASIGAPNRQCSSPFRSCPSLRHVRHRLSDLGPPPPVPRLRTPS